MFSRMPKESGSEVEAQWESSWGYLALQNKAAGERGTFCLSLGALLVMGLSR